MNLMYLCKLVQKEDRHSCQYGESTKWLACDCALPPFGPLNHLNWRRQEQKAPLQYWPQNWKLLG